MVKTIESKRSSVGKQELVLPCLANRLVFVTFLKNSRTHFPSELERAASCSGPREKKLVCGNGQAVRSDDLL